jgi:hypothetical protein
MISLQIFGTLGFAFAHPNVVCYGLMGPIFLLSTAGPLKIAPYQSFMDLWLLSARLWDLIKTV